VAVIIDHTNRRVLEILENRDQQTVTEYLQKARKSGLLQHVTEVTTDMWDGYFNAAKAAFGESVSVVIDRFHVVKNLQERLTAARRLVQKELPEIDRKLLKGSRWLWCKNLENLTAEERAKLQALRTKFPELARLADQRESLRALFEDRSITTSEAAQQRLREWVTTARSLQLKPLDAFCQTLENWLPMIANYFTNRSSNGPTEGFNRGFRTILWQAFGMTNFRHFRLRILDRFNQPQTLLST
jgi:transposase